MTREDAKRLRALCLALETAITEAAARNIVAHIVQLVSSIDFTNAPGAFARKSARAMPRGLPSRVRVEETSVSAGGGGGPIPEAGADPDVAGNGAGQPDWRAARKALRQAGHIVTQHDGQVFVDGQPSDDPALVAA